MLQEPVEVGSCNPTKAIWKGNNQMLEDLLDTIVANYFLNGMILQVAPPKWWLKDKRFILKRAPF